MKHLKENKTRGGEIMPRNTLTPPRYINPDVLSMRIDQAEKADRAQRLQEEKETMQQVRGLSDKETDLFRRVNRAIEKEQQKLQKEHQAWEEQTEEILKQFS